MPRPDPLYFENLGDDFDGFMSDYDVARRLVLVRALMRSAGAPRSCLEVGCGTGKISEALARSIASLTVVDISEALARSVANRLDVEWLAADACALPCADGTYDLVVSSECIEHTANPKRALAEMARVVAPGGTVVVTSPNKLWFAVLQVSIALGARKFRGVENWLWPSEAASVLVEHGLEVHTTSGCHLLPWQIPGAKRLLPALDRFGEQLYPAMINFGIAATKPG